MADITVSKEEWDRVIEILDQANKMVESATPKWISVKERLPENLQSVLVLRKDGGIFIWMYSKESPTDDDFCSKGERRANNGN